MAITDRLTAKARARLEQQVGAGEDVLLSGTVGPVGLVLTTRRLMLAPPVTGAFPDRNLPLGAIQDVAWKKGLLGSQGVLTIRTGSETLEYKVPNKQGEPAAVLIRQAMAAVG
jgi:hypothetical protein